MSFFTMINFAAIIFSLISLAAVISGIDSAPLMNCRSSDKAFNRKVGKWKGSVSFPLMHIYSKCSPFRPPNRTLESLISEKIKADANRLWFLKRSLSKSRSSSQTDPEQQDANAVVPIMPGSGEYIINVGFGTPMQSMYTLIDTGSDVAWIPCKQCQGCDSNAAPPFDSTKSSSYKPLDCNSQACKEAPGGNCGENSECDVQLQYGDGTVVEGLLSSDAITLGAQSLPNFSFACAESIRGLDQNQPGLMGLDRGPLSLLNQPTAKLFGGTFSYCLPSSTSSGSSGSLVLGKEAALSTSGLQFTTLAQNPSNPTFYYVNLMGINVGNTSITLSNTEGTVLDSGTTITYLVGRDYMALRDTFRSQIPNMQPTSTGGFDTCYDFSSSSANVPIITLHFDRKVDLVLPKENILFSPEPGLSCLAFSSTSRSIPPILGNVQQHNFRIAFDVPNSQVGFAQEHCTAA